MNTALMLKKLLLILLLGGSVTMWVGCHTAEGFGEDLESTGEAIQNEAD